MGSHNAIDWHNSIARSFDQRYVANHDFVQRYDVWIKILDRYCFSDSDVLDIGCGSGIFTCYLAGNANRVVGIDGSKEMLAICQEKLEYIGSSDVQLIHGNIMHMPDMDSQFDVVISSSVLEYVDDLTGVFEYVKRQLKDDGVFIFSMPNKNSVYRILEASTYKVTGFPRYYAHVKNVVTIDEMKKRLSILGFSIEEYKYYAGFKFISRLAKFFRLPKYSDNLFVVVARSREK